ncbi:MAG TPA: holo-ACP synthase [Oscillospiraceae bacterium]|jgi:holo-[acyl-carrier protein] synthase|nr:holo-ACP synthase [Oscillospiraceae bacterium]
MNVGIDIIEIDRIEKSIKKPRFLSRVFSPSELKFFMEKSFNPAIIAGNFCAKEAFAKAMGTGIRGFSLNEVSVLRDYMGTPYISVTGRAKKILNAKINGNNLKVSISHSKNLATAIVIAY